MRWKVDFIQKLATTSSAAGPRISSKALPKAKLAKKGSRSQFGGLLSIRSTTAFWIPVKPLQLRSTLSKSMRRTENRTACSRHWPTERAHLLSTTTPDHNVARPTLQKLNKLGYKALSPLPYSPDPTTTFSSISTTVCWEKLPQPAGYRKCFLRVHQIPKHGFLCYRNKPTFFFGESVLTIIVTILINTDVFEPSNNDLQFMIQNHNYFYMNIYHISYLCKSWNTVCLQKREAS